MLRIGVDVGGTNTDAVVMSGTRLLSATKRPTTADIEQGVIDAIQSVLSDADLGASDLNGVMIGTTQFTNAFVEAKRLTPIGVLRLALPATTAVPPFSGWPEALRRPVDGGCYILHGGYQFDGREISPMDETEVRAAARQFRRDGLRSVAISCAFAPINVTMEQRAAAIVAEEVPEVSISLSSAFGRIGLLERENAASMNASLAELARQVVGSFRAALLRLGIKAPLFLSQNDGTLMTSEMAMRHPVMTFASGPTNSMRGAAFLTGLAEAIVVDIGGTTSDIGSLVRGFPRESSLAVDIGGVRTNFRTPDILSLGLGGGSLVVADGDGPPKIGPASVGHRIREASLAFGGDTLTATDIAVAAGWADLGDRARTAHLSPAMVSAAAQAISRMLADGVDRMKVAADEVPLILVGGGALLVKDPPKGVSRLLVPEHSGVANAIGAAIAQVSGEVDQLYEYSDQGREACLASARALANQRAISAGADRASLALVEIEELPLGYLPGNRVRVRAKVVGDLASIEALVGAQGPSAETQGAVQ